MTDEPAPFRTHRSLSISSLCNSPSPAASASDVFSPPLSSASAANLSFDEQDEDVKMAISALSGMRSGTIGHGSVHTPLSSPSSSKGRHASPEKVASTVPTLREFDFKTPGPPASASRFNPALYHPTDISLAAYHLTQAAYEPSATAGTATPSMTSFNGTSVASPASSCHSSAVLDHPQVFLDDQGKAFYVERRSGEEVERGDGADAGVFLGRVGRMPLVSGVVRAYERGKGTSRVVKYGADLVESSVTSIRGRVASHVGPERIAQIDRYAGAALDRIAGPSPERERASLSTPPAVAADEQDGYPFPTRNHEVSSAEENDMERESTGREVQVVPSGGQGPARSRWQSMLVEAGMTAGGIGAAVSEESMKSLKYCLQWLQYANAHLDHQITVLRDFIATLQVSPPTSNSPSTALISASAVHNLAQIKHDVVETIRRVVDVMSKYAGGALPEPAKAFVRRSILSLPVKWATDIYGDVNVGRARGGLNENGAGSTSREGTPSSVCSTPMASPRLGGMSGKSLLSGHGHQNFSQAGQTSRIPANSSQSDENTKRPSGDRPAPNVPSRGATQQAAERVLTFAVDSLDMLKSVTAIFAESVDRADAWVERLRVLGIQHRQQRGSVQRNGQVHLAPLTAAPAASSRRNSHSDRLSHTESSSSAITNGTMVTEDDDETRPSTAMSSSFSADSLATRSTTTTNSKRRKVHDASGRGSTYASAVANVGGETHEFLSWERDEGHSDDGLHLRRKRTLGEGDEE